jgi:hypothetical protein
MSGTVAHVFVFTAVATSASPYFGKVGKAFVDVWIVGKPAEEAEVIARAHVMDQAWVIESLDRQLQISEAEIGNYRADAQATFYQAKRFGLGAAFVTSPPKDRDDDLVTIEKMRPPPSPSGTSQ